MGGDMLQDPIGIIRVIGRHPPLGPANQHPGQLVEIGRVHEPPFVMASLGPRIGKQQKSPVDAGVAQSGQKLGAVVRPHANPRGQTIRPISRHRRKQSRNAVDKRLGADERGVGVGVRLGYEMLAAAKADFEPDARRRRQEQRFRFEPARFGEGGDGKARQERAESLRAPGPQAPTAAPAANARTRRTCGFSGR